MTERRPHGKPPAPETRTRPQTKISLFPLHHTRRCCPSSTRSQSTSTRPGSSGRQPQRSSVFTPASPGEVAAGALGQELSAVSTEAIRRNMNISPTVQVKAGTPSYVFLERDLVFDGPYTDPR